MKRTDKQKRHTIKLRTDAFEKLRALKLSVETYSDLIMRMQPRRTILELADAIPRGSAAKIAAAIAQSRKDRAQLRKQGRA